MKKKQSIIIFLLCLSVLCMLSACRGKDKDKDKETVSVEQSENSDGSSKEQEETVLPEDKFDDTETTDKSSSGVTNAGTKENPSSSTEDKKDNGNVQESDKEEESDKKEQSEGKDEDEQAGNTSREPIVLPGIRLD